MIRKEEAFDENRFWSGQVENILAEKKRYDTWKVNEDAEYQEAGTAGLQLTTTGCRMVPTRLPTNLHDRAPWYSF